jgi:putative FmdB family regulatory protein
VPLDAPRARIRAVPIYEYVCESCARVSEHMQKVSDPPPAACPACGKGPLVKAVSRTSFQLKGGGWYSDLYASPKPEGAAKPAADAPAAPKGEPAKAPAGAPAEPSKPAGGSSGGGTPPAS